MSNYIIDTQREEMYKDNFLSRAYHTIKAHPFATAGTILAGLAAAYAGAAYATRGERPFMEQLKDPKAVAKGLKAYFRKSAPQQ